jgi:regulator of protease activity HflC (stomatin/prohibitin superfamily)
MTIKKLKDLVSSDNPKRRFKDLKNIDEAEGHKTERILAAEAQKEETIRVAEGQATAIELQDDTQRAAIASIAQAIQNPEGQTAMNYTNAQEYIRMMSETMSKGNKNTVFLPTDVTNVEATIARGMGIIGNMDKS